MLTIPALKIQQFRQEFYLLNLHAADVDRLVRFEVLGETGLQGPAQSRRAKGAAGPVNWQEIETRVTTDDKAFQRPILRKKIDELAEYYLQCRDDGALPAIPGAVILTTDAPTTFSQAGPNPFLGMLQLTEDEGSLRVLDGQHRLLALAALLRNPDHGAEGRGLASQIQVPAILFVGLPAPNIIEMFVTINAKHTRLNPSLLVGLEGRKLFGDEMSARVHDVLRKLNNTDGSPLEGHIKLLGVGPGKVQSSGLAQELRAALVETKRRIPEHYDDLEAHCDKFFLSYFKEIAAVLEDAWNSRAHSIRSMIALRAFIQVTPDVIARAARTCLLYTSDAADE